MPINGRSNLTTDPVRNFRFIVQFNPHSSLLRTAPTAPTAGSSSSTTTTTQLFKPTVGFTQVSGLTMTTESIPYREGGYNSSVHQVPGQSSFSPITFVRGVVLGTPQHWTWMKSLFALTQAAKVDVGANFRCDIDIYVVKHPSVAESTTTVTPGSTSKKGVYESVTDDIDKAAMHFKVYNAWPTSIAYSDLNAGDNALMVEQMTVVHEGFELDISSSWASGPAKVSVV
jgi:phage tail-like protein